MKYEIQINLVNEVCASVRYLIFHVRFHVMALSKFASSSTLQDFPTLPSGPNHPSSSFKFPHREFGKKQIVKRSCQSSWFSNGSGYTMMKIATWYFVILVLQRYRGIK